MGPFYGKEMEECMPTANERRRTLRQLMKRPTLIVAPSSFNAWSACLIEAVGFEAIHVSGSSVSRAHAYSDLGLLGMSEMVTIHERIVEGTTLPIVGDAEGAFGGPIQTARTVRAYERAGVAAIHIEDEQIPKNAGAAHSVLPLADMVAKLKAALDSRTDGDFIIIARSNARACESLTQVMDRVSAYADTGVDAIWPGVRLEDELKQLAPTVQLPMVGVPPRQNMSLEAYAGYGFRIGCIPSILGQAATVAMAELLESFKRTGSEEEYWKERPDTQQWRQWFGNLGKKEEEAVARLSEQQSH